MPPSKGSVRTQALPSFEGQITSASSGLCAVVPGGEQRDGLWLRLRSCTDPNARFAFTPVAGKPGVFSIKSLRTWKCLDIRGTSRDDGAPLTQWSCHGKANQQFTLRITDDTDVSQATAFTLTAAHSGKCLQVEASATPGAGPKMV